LKKSEPSELNELLAGLRACRFCRDTPKYGAPLPQEPRPIIQASATARLCIASQAPGLRAHNSGKPFNDPSGIRLRRWLGIGEDIFYDETRIAIIPMGSCFPGYDAKGGDLPPRRECAEIWRERLFSSLPNLELILTIGQYAQKWHLQSEFDGLTPTVSRWQDILAANRKPRILPLPHPSWRNNGWLKNNPWFETDLVPHLQAEIQRLLK
jgi:uracil-DNA glycosylase